MNFEYYEEMTMGMMWTCKLSCTNDVSHIPLEVHP